MEDRSLGMRKAAGSIPAGSILESYYKQTFFIQINKSCILVKIDENNQQIYYLAYIKVKSKKEKNFIHLFKSHLF